MVLKDQKWYEMTRLKPLPSLVQPYPRLSVAPMMDWTYSPL